MRFHGLAVSLAMLALGTGLTFSATAIAEENCEDPATKDRRGIVVHGAGWFEAPAGADGAEAHPGTVWRQDFSEDLAGWEDWGHGRIFRQDSGASSSYASGITSAVGAGHARLIVPQAEVCRPPFDEEDWCIGPFTNLGELDPEAATALGRVVSVDVYLDVAWAAENPDHRADWSVALSSDAGTLLEDFVFNIASSQDGEETFFVSVSHEFSRLDVDSLAPAQAITESGWYTLRHSFVEEAGMLVAEMEILDATGESLAVWHLGSTPAEHVGPLRYGWFASQEIPHLAIDNSTIVDATVDPSPAERTNFRLQVVRTARNGQFFGVFQLTSPTGDLDFRSTGFDCVSIDAETGSVRITGPGRLGDEDGFEFTLWAEAPNRLRVQIRDAGGAVVYDNGVDQAGSALGRGTIRVR